MQSRGDSSGGPNTGASRAQNSTTTGVHLAYGCSIFEWLRATGVESQLGPISGCGGACANDQGYYGIDLWQYAQIGGTSSSGGSGSGRSGEGGDAVVQTTRGIEMHELHEERVRDKRSLTKVICSGSGSREGRERWWCVRSDPMLNSLRPGDLISSSPGSICIAEQMQHVQRQQCPRDNTRESSDPPPAGVH